MAGMNERYWDDIAVRYDDKVISSLHADRTGIVRRRVDELADPSHIAADFGCGVGKYIPLLADRFAQVYGIDLSAKLLTLAAARCADRSNVRFIHADLAAARLRIRKPHVAVCANVLIDPDPRSRRRILRNIHRQLARGGHLLAVVPSTESALFVNMRLLEWNRRQGLTGRAARDESLPLDRRTSARVLDGVFGLDGVPTKHYLKPEATLMLKDAGFEPLHIDQVEYPWQSEFNSPPRWMAAPYPWDWLLVARKA